MTELNPKPTIGELIDIQNRKLKQFHQMEGERSTFATDDSVKEIKTCCKIQLGKAKLLAH